LSSAACRAHSGRRRAHAERLARGRERRRPGKADAFLRGTRESRAAEVLLISDLADQVSARSIHLRLGYLAPPANVRRFCPPGGAAPTAAPMETVPPRRGGRTQTTRRCPCGGGAGPNASRRFRPGPAADSRARMTSSG